MAEATVLSKGTLFPEVLESELMSLVRGKSSLAILSGAEPVPFVGKEFFTFNFQNKISIVGESGAKPAGGIEVEPVTIKPIKVVYQARVTDEFMYASEEFRLDILRSFSDGFAKKLAEGLDEMALHGVNPATGVAAPLIGTNHFDSKVTGNIVTYSAATADLNIDDAVALVEADGFDSTGVIISPAMRSAIAALSTSGGRKYPDFAFGGAPSSLGAMKLEKNNTLGSSKALVGDFQNGFRWGIAKQIPLKTIEYGDPDNAGTDLQAVNQICLRAEAYIGWAIVSGDAFAFVQ